MARHKVEISGVETANIQVLSSSEMEELFKKMKEGDQFARNDLIKGNLKLVLSILKKFTGKVDNLDDLLRTLMEIESNTRDFFISENENNNTDYSDKRLYPKMNKKLIKMENRKYSKMVNTKKK